MTRIQTSDIRQLLHFIRLSHRAQHRKRGSGSDVRRQYGLHTDTIGLLHIKQATSQKEVGCRTVGYNRTSFDQPTAFRIRQMNTMSEDGTVCNQSCPLVYFQVILQSGHKESVLSISSYSQKDASVYKCQDIVRANVQPQSVVPSNRKWQNGA